MDDKISVKMIPTVADEDMKAFQEQLSGLMANATINVPDQQGKRTDSDGGKSDTGTITGMTEEAKDDLADAQFKGQQELSTKGQQILSKVQAPQIEATERMSGRVGGLLEGTKDVCSGIFSGVSTLFDLAKKATEGPLATVLDMMARLLNLIFLPLNIILTMTMLPILEQLANTVGDFINTVFKAYQEKGLAGAIEATFTFLWEQVILPIAKKIAEAVLEVAPKLWKELYDSGGIGRVVAILSGIALAFGAYKVAVLAYHAGKAVVLAIIKGAALGLFTAIGPIVLAVVVIVAVLWIIIANWDTIKEALGKVWDFLVAFWNNLGREIGKLWEKIKEGWKSIKTFFGNLFKPVKDVLEGIWNAIKGVFDGIGGMFDWIPHFAEGGVVSANAPQLAVIGDTGEREIVSPYSTIVRAVGDALTTSNIENTSIGGGRMIVYNTWNISGTNAQEIGESVSRMFDKSVSKSQTKWGM